MPRYVLQHELQVVSAPMNPNNNECISKVNVQCVIMIPCV